MIDLKKKLLSFLNFLCGFISLFIPLFFFIVFIMLFLSLVNLFFN